MFPFEAEVVRVVGFVPILNCESCKGGAKIPSSITFTPYWYCPAARASPTWKMAMPCASVVSVVIGSEVAPCRRVRPM